MVAGCSHNFHPTNHFHALSRNARRLVDNWAAHMKSSGLKGRCTLLECAQQPLYPASLFSRIRILHPSYQPLDLKIVWQIPESEERCTYKIRRSQRPSFLGEARAWDPMFPRHVAATSLP